VSSLLNDGPGIGLDGTSTCMQSSSEETDEACSLWVRA